MEFLIKIAALIIGANMLQEPKDCSCSTTQSVVVITDPKIISLVEYSKSKCVLKNDITISVESGVFAQYTVSVWSNNRLVSKHVLSGKSSVVVNDDIVINRKGRAWILIEPSSQGSHLISVSLSRL